MVAFHRRVDQHARIRARRRAPCAGRGRARDTARCACPRSDCSGTTSPRTPHRRSPDRCPRRPRSRTCRSPPAARPPRAARARFRCVDAPRANCRITTRAQICQRLVQRHPPDALDPEVSRRCAGTSARRRALDDARFARRHLRDDRREHRVLAPRDRRHVDDEVVFLERHIAVRLAERTFRFEIRRHRHSPRSRLRLRPARAGRPSCARTTRIGAPASAPATPISSTSERQFLRSRERHDGRAADARSRPASSAARLCACFQCS